MSHSFGALPQSKSNNAMAEAILLRPKYASIAAPPGGYNISGRGEERGGRGGGAGPSLPRVFAVDMHEVDSNKFHDSREAGFSWYILFTTIIVSLSAATVGWSIGIANASKPIIFRMHGDAGSFGGRYDGAAVPIGGIEFPYRIYFSESMWSVATGVLSVGGFLGALCSGTIANSIGRRNALTINNGLFFAGAVLMGTATTAVHFVLGRFVLGVGCGVASCVANLYVSEIAPRLWRGFFGSFFQCFLLFGILSAQLAAMYIADGMQWRIMVAVPGALALAQAVFLPFRVESPSYLIMSHHINEARHALLTLRRGYDVAAEWQDIMASLDTSVDEPTGCTASCLTNLIGIFSLSRNAPLSSSAAQPPPPKDSDSSDHRNSEATRTNTCINATGRSSMERCDSNATMKDSSNCKQQSSGEKQLVAPTVTGESTLTFTNSVNSSAARIQPQFAKHTASAFQILLGRTREDLRHLVVCSIVLMAMQQLSGITSVLFSINNVAGTVFASSDFLSVAGACIIICVPAVPATVLSMALADKWGRRPLLLASLGLMTLCHVLTSASLLYGPDSMVITMVFICFVAFNVGIGSVPWYYITECIPSYALSATMVVGCSLYWVLAVAVDLLIPLIQSNLPQWLFVFFGSFTLAGFLFALLFVPETKTRSVAHTIMEHEGPLHTILKKSAAIASADYTGMHTE
ncbi:Bifunctional purine biosynthesis protein PurH [Coemansia sp. RSA 1813]|nr:Bifunctional purine biosynthesis protein PurH [Coemansia sp. RSA 1646]KAJ1772734.1 Bifunctional purine biosynthesis protein PurH [Coemansia sp. RSA 1843]KAJ2090686.1 Bifunctional purine biosynthesis protein PurH [Coemansia sp. RSA 986]KAJ2216111.1 Bifunctional purine biosynthesis protein PurH [Coemansia sp. RSA 487]KAJ2570095.1 Bifunctional purine biosynthesis protein PurH [Coemansia sp. RSA 1813]